MSRVRFGDVVRDVKLKVDRDNNPYEFYLAGEHFDSERLFIPRRGRFEGSDVGPAFIRIFKPGQVLYGSRRTYLKKVAVADFEGITANTTFVLESKDENVLMQGLLPFIMLSGDFTKWSIDHSKGSTNPYVLFSDLAEYEFELPPIEIQRKLSDLLREGEGLKEVYRRLLVACDELVKSRFVEMFVNDDFPIVQLGDYCVNINNGMARRGNDPDGSIVLRLVELQEGFLDYSSVNRITLTDKERARYLLHDGDLLFARVNGNPDNVGRCATFFDVGEPVFHNDHIIRASIASNDFEPSYLTCFINGAQGREQIKTSLKTSAGQYTINQDGIKGIRLPKPPLTLQQDFAAFVQQVDKSELCDEMAVAA